MSDKAEPTLDAWHAECDAVGIPHDPKSLVRHHRNNGILQGSTEMLNAIIKNWKARCAQTGEDPDWRWMLDGPCVCNIDQPATKGPGRGE